jgi:hypothetical protein
MLPWSCAMPFREREEKEEERGERGEKVRGM